LKVAQMTEKLIVPCQRAFRPWRKVTGFTRAGKTKAHWQNSYLPRVAKDVTRHPHPLAQQISAGIIESWI